MKSDVKTFLSDIASNEIVQGKQYGLRIEIDDGGDNSYIGFNVYTENYNRKIPVTREVSVYRHSNSVNKLIETWKFDLGGVCNALADNPETPLMFSSYGKTPEEAEKEAQNYYKELKRLIKKRTSEYKVEAAKTAEEEKEKLLARLAELEAAK